MFRDMYANEICRTVASYISKIVLVVFLCGIMYYVALALDRCT